MPCRVQKGAVATTAFVSGVSIPRSGHVKVMLMVTESMAGG